MAQAVSPAAFPDPAQQLGDGSTFNAIESGHYKFEGFSVAALEIPHKGGRTFGYRVSDGSATLAYLQITALSPWARARTVPVSITTRPSR